MNNYKFVSIDGATNKTGMALFINGKLSDYCIIDKSSVKDPKQRISDMCKNVLEVLKTWKPQSVRIEYPQGQMNVTVTGMICQILGAVRAYCVFHDCDYSDVMPSVWRKHLGIKQGAKIKRDELKKQSIDLVKQYFDMDVSDDLADAICIGISMIKEYNPE